MTWREWLSLVFAVALWVDGVYWWRRARKAEHRARNWQATAEFLGRALDARTVVVDGEVRTVQ